MWMMIQKAKLFGDEVCAAKLKVRSIILTIAIGNRTENDANDSTIGASSAGAQGERL